MKIKILDSFSLKLINQIKYIAKDKPKAARKFKKDIITQIKQLNTMPYKNKASIYFNDKNIRDLTFKGYTYTELNLMRGLLKFLVLLNTKANYNFYPTLTAVVVFLKF